MGDTVRKLKSQRRRNAKTIDARNAEIRELKEKVDFYKEIIDDYRFANKLYRKVLEEQIKKHGGL